MEHIKNERTRRRQLEGNLLAGTHRFTKATRRCIICRLRLGEPDFELRLVSFQTWYLPTLPSWFNSDLAYDSVLAGYWNLNYRYLKT